MVLPTGSLPSLSFCNFLFLIPSPPPVARSSPRSFSSLSLPLFLSSQNITCRKYTRRYVYPRSHLGITRQLVEDGRRAGTKRGRAGHEGTRESKGGSRGAVTEGDFRFRVALRYVAFPVYFRCILAHRTWRVATSHCASGERGAATPPPLFPSKPLPGRPQQRRRCASATTRGAYYRLPTPAGVWCLRLQSHDGPCAALFRIPACCGAGEG